MAWRFFVAVNRRIGGFLTLRLCVAFLWRFIMSEFTKEEIQEAYVKAIEILFNGAVAATPDQISEQVIKDVDVMIREITKCSASLTELSFKLIYKAAMMVASPIIDDYTNNFYTRLFIKQGGGKSWEKILLDWIKALQGNRRHMLCLITARTKWRSKIEIELLGL